MRTASCTRCGKAAGWAGEKVSINADKCDESAARAGKQRVDFVLRQIGAVALCHFHRQVALAAALTVREAFDLEAAVGTIVRRRLDVATRVERHPDEAAVEALGR